MDLRRWLAVPVVLTVLGSAFQVGAEPAEISVVKLELTDNPLSAKGEMRQPKLVSQFPNPIPPREPELPAPAVPSPQSEPLLPVTPVPAAPEPRPDIPGTVTVERFEFEGNTAFSAEELRDLLKPLTGKPITFAELLRAEAAVTKLYTDAGYINSGAVIPADQTLNPAGAVVKIQIVEGGLAEIKVTGTRRLNPNYVRSRLEVATQKPLNQFRLLEALQLLQIDPLIANISAELSAGSRPELSLLEVRVKEADSFRVELFADNGRAPSVGSFRRGVRISEGNVLGLGDSLSLEYTNTDGSNAYDARYTVPVNPRNGTVTLSAGLTDTNVIEPPFDRLDITGNSRYYELSFRQPVIQTPTTELALGLTASRQESETELLGEGFPLSAGADEDGRTRISALRFFQDYTQRSRQQVFALRSQFSVGIGAFDATINNSSPDSRFLSWRGQAQYVRLLAPDTLLLLRSDVQLATETLVPLEQFGSGGLRSVRGYRQDALLTDLGAFVSAEVQLPVLRAPEVNGVLHAVPFVDFGYGTNLKATPDPDPNTLLGVGVGLQWQMGDNFTARLDYGIPLIYIESRDRTWQEKGFYFSINYNPF